MMPSVCMALDCWESFPFSNILICHPHHSAVEQELKPSFSSWGNWNSGVTECACSSQSCNVAKQDPNLGLPPPAPDQGRVHDFIWKKTVPSVPYFLLLSRIKSSRHIQPVCGVGMEELDRAAKISTICELSGSFSLSSHRRALRMPHVQSRARELQARRTLIKLLFAI